jgi:hypothetical protein
VAQKMAPDTDTAVNTRVDDEILSGVLAYRESREQLYVGVGV